MRITFISILLLISSQSAVLAESVVRVEVFCDSTEKSCTFVRDEVIAPLAETYGDTFAYRYFHTGEQKAVKRFERIEMIYKDRFNSLPAVFINDRIIGGRTNIKRKLKAKVKQSLATGSAWADTSQRAMTLDSAKPGAAHVLVFYAPDCGYCKDVKTQLLPELRKKYNDRVFFHLIDVETARGNGILRLLEKKHGEPGNYVPAAFAAGKFLSGKNEVNRRLDWWVGETVRRGGCNVPREAR